MGHSVYTGSTDEVVLDVYKTSATSDTTTTSATDVVLDSMTLTPGAGTYAVFFNSSHINSANGGVTFVSIYVGGVQVAESEVRGTSLIQGVVVGNQPNQVPISTHSSNIVVNGNQTIEVRWRRSSGTSTMHQRTLSAIRTL